MTLCRPLLWPVHWASSPPPRGMYASVSQPTHLTKLMTHPPPPALPVFTSPCWLLLSGAHTLSLILPDPLPTLQDILPSSQSRALCSCPEWGASPSSGGVQSSAAPPRVSCACLSPPHSEWKPFLPGVRKKVFRSSQCSRGQPESDG